MVAYGKYFYRIERYQADNVTKFDVAAPGTVIWQYSTLDDGETVSSNPYDLVFASETKAYLLRWGRSTAWIVNPSATTQADFKIGELDLSAYADYADGVPGMAAGLILDGKLFIIMQNIDQSGDYTPGTPYVAVLRYFHGYGDRHRHNGGGQRHRASLEQSRRYPVSARDRHDLDQLPGAL